MELYFMYWIIVFISSCFCYSVDKVHLNVVQKEILLGKPLHISCEILSNKTNASRKWYGGKNFRLLCLNGVSSNLAKYNEIKLSPRKYHLVITNVTEYDLNYPYACWVGFLTAEMVLSTDESNFLYLPEEDTTHVKYVKESGSYSLQVMFDKVFPVPTCIAKTMAKPRKLNSVEKRNGIFYTVQFSYESEEPFHSCGSPVEIECTIKDYQYTINHPHSFECSDSKPTSNMNHNILITVIVLTGVILVLLGTALITSIKYNRLKRGRWKQEINEGEQDSKKPLHTA